MKKIRPFLGVMLAAFCQLPVLGQAVLPADEVKTVKLYQAKIRTMTSRQTDGILYAVSDSAILVFANNPSTIELLREGNPVPIDTIRASTIKRIAVWRKGHFGRTMAIGTGVTAALATTTLLSTANSEKRLTGVVLALIGVPVGLVTTLMVALPPLMISRINGQPEQLASERVRLDRYSISSQTQRP